MTLIRGPFTLKWGDNTIRDVEEIDFELDVDSEEYNTVQGNNYELDGAYKSALTLTLLGTDLASLAMLLPQNFVANGQQMSTGETVNNANGAIDVVPQDCTDVAVYKNFDIISCGNPAQVTRLVNARTRIDGVEFDDKVQKVLVRVVGEPGSGDGVLQFFRQNTINVVS